MIAVLHIMLLHPHFYQHWKCTPLHNLNYPSVKLAFPLVICHNLIKSASPNFSAIGRVADRPLIAKNRATFHRSCQSSRARGRGGRGHYTNGGGSLHLICFPPNDRRLMRIKVFMEGPIIGPSWFLPDSGPVNRPSIAIYSRSRHSDCEPLSTQVSIIYSQNFLVIWNYSFPKWPAFQLCFYRDSLWKLEHILKLNFPTQLF